MRSTPEAAAGGAYTHHEYVLYTSTFTIAVSVGIYIALAYKGAVSSTANSNDANDSSNTATTRVYTSGYYFKAAAPSKQQTAQQQLLIVDTFSSSYELTPTTVTAHQI